MLKSYKWMDGWMDGIGMGWKSLKALILRAPLCGANNHIHHHHHHHHHHQHQHHQHHEYHHHRHNKSWSKSTGNPDFWISEHPLQGKGPNQVEMQNIFLSFAFRMASSALHQLPIKAVFVHMSVHDKTPHQRYICIIYASPWKVGAQGAT